MCNLLRYKERKKLDLGFEEFRHVRIEPKLRYKVAPSEPAPVLTLREGRPQIDMLRFGLQTRLTGRQLMARGETVAKLRTFREAFRSRRCLVLVDGFYDSQDMGGYRQPWHFQLKNDAPMLMAGLWEPRPEDAGNFAIISAPANRLMARVIDRMPVILSLDQCRRWLDATAEPEELQSMLVTLPSEQMESWPVTRRLNQRGFESPECLEPIALEQDELDLW